MTDAMEMAGVRAAWTGEAAVRAVQAGADVILLPPRARRGDPGAGARRARGRSSREARIDESVLRILEAKERLGPAQAAHGRPAPAPARRSGRPEDVERAAGDRAPVDHGRAQRGRRAAAARRGAAAHPAPRDVERRAQRRRRRAGHPGGRARGAGASRPRRCTLGPEVSEETAREILARARGVHARARVRASCGWPRSAGTADMSEAHAALLRRCAAAGRAAGDRVVRQPVPAAAVPRRCPSYVCAYGWRRDQPARGDGGALRRVRDDGTAAGHAARAATLRRRAAASRGTR